ncbi:MAG: hypothetical protein G3M78_15320 [Candidatus Nitrohelix vancouverensis]|uniref:Uncharacterized protein n=1 Tax=Candidatus Nitrohelix vancouverensis TaxID=2705534 RepID=A0A7T0C5B8_9BACT|nr:MAG: hypothetical protein G3M78_15320 [Candidatus Nitrohelix vancouverensis]
MSPRYYIITGLLVLVGTVAVSYWKQVRGAKEIVKVFFGVLVFVLFLFSLIFGMASLLEHWGIAESGFIL